MLLLSLLACLLAIVESAYRTPPPDPNIDWSGCGTSALCGVFDSPHCLKKTTGTGSKLIMGVEAADIFDTCKTGVWIRPLSGEEWLVKMQVSNRASDTHKIDPIRGLILRHNGISQFGCIPYDNDVEAQAWHGVHTELYKLETSRLQNGDCYCSFTINDLKGITRLRGIIDMTYAMTAVVASPKKKKNSEKFTFFMVPALKQCDVSKAEKLADPPTNLKQKSFEVRLTDEQTMAFTCDMHRGYKLYAAYKTLKAEPVKSIECQNNAATGLKWKFVIETKTVGNVFVDENEPFAAFCGKISKSESDDTEHPLPSIDWNTCGSEAMCGAEGKCVSDPTNDFVFPTTSVVATDCDAGIWIRPLSASIWMIKLQVRNKDIDFIRGLSILHNNRVLLGCIAEDADQNLVFAHGLRELDAVIYEDRYRIPRTVSRLLNNDAYCEIVVNNAKHLMALPEWGSIRLKFVMNAGFRSQIDGMKTFRVLPELRRCDPFHVENLNVTYDGIVKLSITDLLLPSLQCTAHHPKAKLYAAKDLKTAAIPVQSVDCKLDEPDWLYHIVHAHGNEEHVAKDADLHAFCGVPVNMLCADPEYKVRHAPTFTLDPKTYSTSLECPNKQWLINKAFYYEGQRAVCKNSVSYNNSAAWFVTRQSDGKEVEITEAECAESKSCKIATQINDTCPSATECAPLLKNDGIKCPIEHTLSVTQASGSKLTMKKLVCNEESGRWIVDERRKEIIDEGANVYCKKDELAPVPPPPNDLFILISIIAIAIVAAVTMYFIIRFVVKEIKHGVALSKRKKPNAQYSALNSGE